MWSCIIKFLLPMLVLNIELYAQNLNYYNIFDFKVTLLDGKELDLETEKGKVLLIINVPAKCGFTGQLQQLEQVWQQYKDRGLLMIAIPSNDFNDKQASTNKVDDKECKLDQIATFPIAAPSKVIGDNAHPIYQWLKASRGMASIPENDYFKVIIDSDGEIKETYGNNISILSSSIIKSIENSISRIIPNY